MSGQELLFAAEEGKKDEVVRLLNRGANINYADRFRETALYCACNGRHSDVALLLIERGADVNAADANGTTPLISASERNLVDVVQSLLYKGSNVNVRNNKGLTALHCAISYETVVALFENEADIDAIDNEGRNALHHAAVCGNVDVVRFLLSKGSYCNTVDINGKTPLDLARDNNSTEVMEIIKNQLETDKNSVAGSSTQILQSPSNNVVEESEKLKRELGELKSTLDELLKQTEKDKLEATKRESELNGELTELKTTLCQLLNQTEKDKLEATKREHEMKEDMDSLKIKLEGLVSGVAVETSTATSAEVIMPQIVAPLLAKMTESCKEIADNLATKQKLVASKPERDNWRFKIESKLNSTEQEQILNTLEINGLPEKSDENLISILASVVHHLGLAFPSDLIRVCRQTSVYPEATNKSRSIVVTFQRVETAQTWLKAFREKRSTGILASSLDKSFSDDKIYINQKLTHFNKKLLHRVKEFAKTNQYKFVWVQDGKILLRKNEDAPIIRIKSGKDIPPQ